MDKQKRPAAKVGSKTGKNGTASDLKTFSFTMADGTTLQTKVSKAALPGLKLDAKRKGQTLAEYFAQQKAEIDQELARSKARADIQRKREWLESVPDTWRTEWTLPVVATMTRSEWANIAAKAAELGVTIDALCGAILCREAEDIGNNERQWSSDFSRKNFDTYLNPQEGGAL